MLRFCIIQMQAVRLCMWTLTIMLDSLVFFSLARGSPSFPKCCSACVEGSKHVRLQHVLRKVTYLIEGWDTANACSLLRDVSASPWRPCPCFLSAKALVVSACQALAAAAFTLRSR